MNEIHGSSNNKEHFLRIKIRRVLCVFLKSIANRDPPPVFGILARYGGCPGGAPSIGPLSLELYAMIMLRRLRQYKRVLEYLSRYGIR